MHIVENYSSKLLCKIDKPILMEKFYPIPEKYIVLNVGGAMIAKVYDYWQICIDFLLPELNKNNIQIIQLGDKTEPRLKGTNYLAGQTDFHQSSYIVHNALLHVGTDSALVHVASAFNTPILATYSVSGPELCGPYWGDKTKQILLEPNFKENQSYSYNPGEQVKVINTINPEQIVAALGKLLNIEFPKFETIFIGPKYNSLVSEVVPNCIIPLEYFPGQPLSIRFDFCEKVNEENLNFAYQNLFNRQCSLRTQTEIPLAPIIQNPRMKQNLSGIALDLTNDGFSEDYVKSLIENQIRFILAYGGDSEDQLKRLKLKFCEYGIIQRFHKNTQELKDILDDTKFDPSKIIVRSNRVIIDNQKIFTSQTSMEDKLSVEQTQNLQFPLSSLRNWPEICQDGDFLYLYKNL